jgi:hypothetical protein
VQDAPLCNVSERGVRCFGKNEGIQTGELNAITPMVTVGYDEAMDFGVPHAAFDGRVTPSSASAAEDSHAAKRSGSSFCVGSLL